MNALIGPDMAGHAPVGTGFRITPHDRLTIEGMPYRLASRSGDVVFLEREDGQGVVDQYTAGTLARLSATGHVRHEPEYHLPPCQRTRPATHATSFYVSMLAPAQKKRFHICHAQVQALDDMVSEGLIRPATADIEREREELKRRVEPYLAETVSERDMLAHQATRDGSGKAAKRRGGRKTESVELYSSDYLRKLHAIYRKGGVEALVDKLSKSGNRTSPFRPEEHALLMETIKASYLTPERKALKATVTDVRRRFQAENERRSDLGLAPLRVPGRDAVRSAIGSIGKFRVTLERYGLDHAMKKFRPVGKGPEISRPGERVEIDEWRIDLASIMSSTSLIEALGPDVMEAIGLDNETSRWWLSAAIDCRTRVFLGAILTRNPASSTARECLRMVVSDKSAVSDAVGAVVPWSQAVTPEVLVCDNGPAFKSQQFRDSCLDLQVTFQGTIAGVPGMRGMIERVFRTAGLDLMPRLKGRTFSNPQERGDYNAHDRACLDAENLAFVLMRWIVDIYHNSPHEGLGGRTPLEQWEADMREGNYPLRALPDTRSKRLAFGVEEPRKVSRKGVVVMGVHFHNPVLAMHFAERGGQVVQLRWDPEDLGAVEVFINGEWIELPAVHDRFKGVSLHVWLKARKALRARSASRKKWNQDTVFRAIDEIEALVRKGSVLFGVVDKSVSAARLAQLEKEHFSSFMVDTAAPLQADVRQPGREISPHAPDLDTPRDAREARRKSKSGKAGKSVKPPRDAPPHDTPDLDKPAATTKSTTPKPGMPWLPRKQDGSDQ